MIGSPASAHYGSLQRRSESALFPEGPPASGSAIDRLLTTARSRRSTRRPSVTRPPGMHRSYSARSSTPPRGRGRRRAQYRDRLASGWLSVSTLDPMSATGWPPSGQRRREPLRGVVRVSDSNRRSTLLLPVGPGRLRSHPICSSFLSGLIEDLTPFCPVGGVPRSVRRRTRRFGARRFNHKQHLVPSLPGQYPSPMRVSQRSSSTAFPDRPDG